jgi:hypothetical protein
MIIIYNPVPQLQSEQNIKPDLVPEEPEVYSEEEAWEENDCGQEEEGDEDDEQFQEWNGKWKAMQ